MLRGDWAASSQARGTRGGAVAADRPSLQRVMPEAFPSGPQVLPELRAMCAPAPARSAGSSEPPRLSAHALGLSPGEGRLLCAAFEAVNSPAWRVRFA